MTTEKNNSIINISSNELVQHKNKFKSIAIYNEEIYESEVVELINENNEKFGTLVLTADTTTDKKGLIISPKWTGTEQQRTDVAYTWKALAPDGYTDLTNNKDIISIDTVNNTLTILDQTQLDSAITITVVAYKEVKIGSSDNTENIFVAQSTPYTVFGKGQEGEAGKDGSGVKYKYCLTNSVTKPEYPAPAGANYTWTDAPQGVSESNQYEYVVSIITSPIVTVAKKIDTELREYDEETWKKYGAAGHEENWTVRGTGPFDNSHIHLQDYAYVEGIITDSSPVQSVKLYGRVIGLTQSSTSGGNVRMRSEFLMIGDQITSDVALWAKWGNDGVDYTALIISGAQTFIKNPNVSDNPITPTSVTLTPNLYGDLVGKTVTWKQGTTTITSTSSSSNIYKSGNNLIVKSSAFGTNNTLTFTASVDGTSYNDDYSVYLLSEGANGNDAYSAYLTDQSWSFSADKDGKIAANVEKTTSVKIFKGITEITTGVGITKVEGTLKNTLYGVFTYSNTSPTLTFKSNNSNLGSNNSQDGQITITAMADGKEFTLGLSWDKTNTGADGANGSNVKQLHLPTKSFSTDSWKIDATIGREVGWSASSKHDDNGKPAYDNSHVHKGDTGYFQGIVKDKYSAEGVYQTITIYGEVLGFDTGDNTELSDTFITNNESMRIVLKTTSAQWGGTIGGQGPDGVFVYLLPSTTSITKTGDDYSPSSIILDMMKKSGDNAPESIGITGFKYSLSIDGAAESITKADLVSKLDISSLSNNPSQSIVISIYDTNSKRVDVKTISINVEALSEYVLYHSNTTTPGTPTESYYTYKDNPQIDNNGQKIDEWVKIQQENSLWQSKKSAYPSKETDTLWGAPVRISGTLTNYDDLYKALNEVENNANGVNTGIYALPPDDLGIKRIGVSADVIKTGALKIGNSAENKNNRFYADIDTKEVYISGWTVNETSITKGTLGVYNSFHMGTEDLTTEESKVSIGGSDAKSDWRLGIGSNFGVTKDGEVYATAGKIGEIEIGNIAYASDVDEAKKATIDEVKTLGYQTESDVTQITKDTVSTETIIAKNLTAGYIQSDDYASGAGTEFALDFTLVGDHYKVGLKSTGIPSEVLIPESYNGKSVAELDVESFVAGKDIIQKLAIPAGITTNPFGLLKDYTELVELHIPVHQTPPNSNVSVINLSNYFGSVSYGDGNIIPPLKIEKIYLIGSENNNTIPDGYFDFEHWVEQFDFYIPKVYITPSIPLITPESVQYASVNEIYYYNDTQINFTEEKISKTNKIYKYPSVAIEGFCITSKEDCPMIDSPNFRVAQDGTIYAKAGMIGGVAIDDIGVKAETIQSSDYEINKTGFKITSVQNENMIDSFNFKVTQNGEVTANKGNIAGWEIDEYNISKGSISLVSSDSENLSSLIPGSGISNIRIKAGRKIKTVSVVETTSQSKQEFIYSPEDCFSIKDITASYDVSSGGGSLVTEGIGSKIVKVVWNGSIGTRVMITYIYETTELNFAVLEDGSLYASAANISGEIYADKGKIAKWQSGLVSEEGAAQGIYHTNPYTTVGMAGTDETDKPVFWAGCQGGTPWEVEDYKKQTNFFVTADGFLTCKGGTVEDLQILSGKLGDIALTSDSDGARIISKNKPMIIGGEDATFTFTKGAAASSYYQYELQVCQDPDGHPTSPALNKLGFKLVCYSITGTNKTLAPSPYRVTLTNINFKRYVGTELKEWDRFNPALVLDINSTESNQFNKTFTTNLFYDDWVEISLDGSTDYLSFRTDKAEVTATVQSLFYIRQNKEVSQFQCISNTSIIPETDSLNYLGVSGKRWAAGWFDELYCTAGYPEDSGSDERIKNSIEILPNEYEQFFDKIEPARYKYNNGTSNRYHTGFIAQQLVKSLEESGLTTQDFAGVMLNHPGEEDECWYLRRDEFVALNTWQIQKLKARAKQAEETIALQDAYIKKLGERIEKLEQMVL